MTLSVGMEITFHDLPKGVSEDETRSLCALVGLAATARHHRLRGLNTDFYFIVLESVSEGQHGWDAGEDSLISSGSEERERKLSLLKGAIIPFMRVPLS